MQVVGTMSCENKLFEPVDGLQDCGNVSVKLLKTSPTRLLVARQ